MPINLTPAAELSPDVSAAIDLLLDPAYATDVRIICEETPDSTWYSLEFGLLESYSRDESGERGGPWITANSNGVQFDLCGCQTDGDRPPEYLSFCDESIWLLGICAGHYREICLELHRRGQVWYCQQCGNTGFYQGAGGDTECDYCDTLERINAVEHHEG